MVYSRIFGVLVEPDVRNYPWRRFDHEKRVEKQKKNEKKLTPGATKISPNPTDISIFLLSTILYIAILLHPMLILLTKNHKVFFLILATFFK